MEERHSVERERLLARIQAWSPPPIARTMSDVGKAMTTIADHEEQDAAWMREWSISKNQAGDGFLGPDGILYETVKDAVLELTKKNFPKPQRNRLSGRVGGNGHSV